MTEREPAETTNLDRYGSPALPWRRAHVGAAGRALPRAGVAGGGRGRRVHGPLQRAERRAAAMAPLPRRGPHRIRGRRRGAARRDALAVRPLREAAPERLERRRELP